MTSFAQCFLFYRTGFTAGDLRRTTSACYRLGYCYVLVNRVYICRPISPNVKKRRFIEISPMLRHRDLFFGQLSTSK